MAGALMERFGLSPGIRTLIPAPMYHTAPNVLASVAAVLGMDVTIMASFDAEHMLALVERHRIQQIQMVPTMFIRLLRLPEPIRAKYDLSSLTKIVHTAAPCPVEVKRQMIDWLGPTGRILRRHRDRPGGVVQLRVLAGPRRHGWLARGRRRDPHRRHRRHRRAHRGGGHRYIKPPSRWPAFSYLGDEAKRRAMELAGFVTVGDVGRVDADGFLYLTDRASDMVISGGVNIYPVQIEAALTGLAGVRDSAVFGIPDEDFGEVLAAHIELEPGAALTEDDVRGYVHAALAGDKAPKVVVFTDELPREETGKLYKRKLRALYWADSGRTI